MISLWRWLAAGEPGPTLDPGPFAGYGVVGALAVSGLWFAYTAYRQANSERVELQAKLLGVYEVVLPALESATAAIRECTTLLQTMRHDAELERVRREGQQ